jgi:allantoicase
VAQRSTGLASFTGNANPYGGGDPYADYRTAEFEFTQYANLAARELGAGVIAANDEFFAERENLLIAEAAHFDPEHFGHKGKVMDGWETRRRRGVSAEQPWPTAEDHDYALIRLGAPGVIRGIVVDTAHFRGNMPQAVSVQAAAVEGSPTAEELLSDDVKWTTLVERTPVGGHAANGFAVDVEQRFTHLRLNQHPAARLRRGPPRPEVARGAGHLRRRGPGERRLRRGRLQPLLLPADQHHQPGPLPQDGRRLGDRPPP